LLLVRKGFRSAASHCKSIVLTEFFKPVFGYVNLSRFRRNCPALTDSLWLEAGIRRCLVLFQSGRDFLQDLTERHETETKRKGKTLAKRDAQSRSNGGGLTVIQQCIQRLTQRIVKFIRWLKNHLDSKRPATLRAAVFIGGALLGNRSRTPVLYIAQSWGGLEKHKPLLDNI
jgi:hypothetical protein